MPTPHECVYAGSDAAGRRQSQELGRHLVPGALSGRIALTGAVGWVRNQHSREGDRSADEHAVPQRVAIALHLCHLRRVEARDTPVHIHRETGSRQRCQPAARFLSRGIDHVQRMTGPDALLQLREGTRRSTRSAVGGEQREKRYESGRSRARHEGSVRQPEAERDPYTPPVENPPRAAPDAPRPKSAEAR